MQAISLKINKILETYVFTLHLPLCANGVVAVIIINYTISI